MVGLDQTADVYTPAVADGDYTVLVKPSLVCRLAYVGNNPVDVGDEREATGQRRRLLWAEAYDMPEEAQVEVEGERWNVLAGTLGKLRGPNRAVLYCRCEVVSVKI